MDKSYIEKAKELSKKAISKAEKLYDENIPDIVDKSKPYINKTIESTLSAANQFSKFT